MKAPPRPSMSKARRARIFEAHGGICEICGAKIAAGVKYEIEHRIPWALGHDDSDANLYPAHPECHHAKTVGEDRPRIDKAKAQAGETGQRARRAKHGPSLKSGPTKWPKGRKLESRGFERRKPK